MCHVVRTLGAGGAQDLLVNLAREAPELDVQLSVLALTPADGHAVTRELRELQVPVVGLTERRALSPRGMSDVIRGLRELAPDAVHTHGKLADVVAGVAARRLRLPQVSTLHLVERPTSSSGRAAGLLAARVRNHLCARVIMVSDAQRQWYLDAFQPRHADRVLTIHNGVPAQPHVPPGERRRVRAELGVAEAEVLALAVGLLREDRGHTHLLAARALLPDGLMTLVLAGDGPLRSALEQQALATAGPRVVFAGFRRDVPALLAAADLLVHPSTTDALPTAVMQGLAAGLPVIASDVDGIPEILGGGAGVLVPPAAPPALAQALAAIASDAPRREALARAARQRHADHFTARAWAARLAQVYAELVPTENRDPQHHA